MIWFDRTQRSIVAGCAQCGAREVCLDQPQADRWALDHVYRAHPAPSHEHMQAITAGRVRRYRRDTP